ncbi:MAG: cyclase family protein, partial [Chlamydiales bacterium]|nr:cyclase family protein [Chlamydiales bacterium]
MFMFKQINWIDLTHIIHPQIPTWNGSCGFCHKTILDYGKTGVKVMKFEMHAGVGTHMDAPSHFKEGEGVDVADVPLDKLIGPLCVIDVRKKMTQDLMIGIKDIKAFEQQFGKIPKNSFVVGYTGWDQFWSSPNQYRNEDKMGNMHFPGFDEKAAAYLLDKEISGIGIDTLSPDGSNMQFPVHKVILGAKKIILENLTNLHQVPAIGSYLFAIPAKIQFATEATVRA